MYNIKMVATLLGLSPVTIRAWETRYNIVQPTRSESGHRLYSDEDVEDLRWLQLQTREKGLSISHAAQMLQKKKQMLHNPADSEPDDVNEITTNSGIASNYLRLQNDLYLALIEMDIEQADRIVDLGFSMLKLEDMLHKVMVPLMIRVGDEWEQGIISVAQEHMVSEFVKQRYIQFLRLFERNPSLPKAIALCPSGERHEIGLLLFSLFLRRKGLDLIYLGADTPVDGIPEMLNVKHADLLCLSLTNPKKLNDTVTYIEHVRAACPQVKIMLGGKGFEALADNHPYRSFVIGDHIAQWEHWYQHLLVTV